MTKRNLKKQIRARMDKTDESYQTALRHVRGDGGESPGQASITEPASLEAPDITAILDEFRVGHISSIEIYRLSGGRSADHAVARRHAADLANNPKWGARSEGISRTLTRAEFDAFGKLGATERGQIQTIAVRHHREAGVTFSVQCARCHLWINTRDSETESQCICGQRFRVVFEQTAEWTPAQLKATRFIRCAGCGGELGMHPKGNPLGEWNPLTESQTACRACKHDHRVSQWLPAHALAVPDDTDMVGIPNTLYQYEVGGERGVVRAGTASLAVLQVLGALLKSPIDYDDVEWTLAGDTCATGRVKGHEATAVLTG